MVFGTQVRDALCRAANRWVLSRPPRSRVSPLVHAIIEAARKPLPKPRTKEQARGWSARLSFKTHRKLTQMGYQVL